jgi:hypothetical protein
LNREGRAQSTLTLARHCPLSVLILLFLTLLYASGVKVPLHVTSDTSSPHASDTLVFLLLLQDSLSPQKKSKRVRFSSSVILSKDS